MAIRSLRTKGCGNLVTVWCEGSWTSGSPPDEVIVHVRGILVWRKESDGRWRLAIEHLS